jgi:hypothetical protein
MPTPDIWVTLLPLIYSAVWGSEALYDPAQTFYVGPAPSQIVVGAGGIFKANNNGQVGAGEMTLGYVHGFKAYGFQPKLTSFVTARGDVVIGLGVQNEIVFDKLSLLRDGSAPLFFSFTAAPARYFPDRVPGEILAISYSFKCLTKLAFMSANRSGCRSLTTIIPTADLPM